LRTLVTGAAGFIGARLLKSLLVDPSVDEITAVDLAPAPPEPFAKRLRWVRGAIDDPAVLDEIFTERFDQVFHLASVAGGRAEREPALGRRVNLDASLNLLDRLTVAGRRPRVVYASSIAVYGDMGAGPVSSKTPTRPMITYGAHKRMVEIALSDLTRRGDISGIAVRLPGIVARPSASTSLGSAFMSDLLRAFAEGRPYVCPVSPEATCWWMSAACVVRNLRLAAAIDAVGEVQLPALRLSVREVVDALAGAYGQTGRSLVQFAPDPFIEGVFGRYPRLDTADSEALGFIDDGAASSLIAAALADD
jgi:nucleoside-diphosphate-sugar epimerase